MVMEADDADIQLVTRCTSADEFIERFARFTTETDIVVPAQPHMNVGTAGQFTICLKDRSVMMKGRCEVTEIRPVAVAPGAGPPASLPALMRLRLREMDAHSCGLHLRLMERRASSLPPPAAPPPPGQSVGEAVPAEMPVVDQSAVTVVGEARPPWDTETTAISPAPQPEARVPGAAFTLPANPLSDLDAADLASFVEHTLGVAPSAPAVRSAARSNRARRISPRAAPYAATLLVGILLGMALRPGWNPAPVVRAPTSVPTSEAAPTPTATAPAEASPAEPAGSAVVAERLDPPPANVVVTPSPPHAVIKLSKRRVGHSNARRALAAR